MLTNIKCLKQCLVQGKDLVSDIIYYDDSDNNNASDVAVRLS